MTSGADHHAWDTTWESGPANKVVGFDAPTFQNYIDCIKLEFIGRDMPRQGSAIEVGCGSARLLLRVGFGSQLELFALDSSLPALRLARANASSVRIPLHVVGGDAYSIPLATGSCDLVLSGGLLEHFKDPFPILSEMIRVLRPGGTFYADVVPRRFSLFRLLELPRLVSSPWMMPGVYESTFGPSRYRAWLERLGCKEIRIQSGGVYPPLKPAFWSRWTRFLDGTFVARLLGWYFMIVAKKAD
jgi:SAM-dependent methyltransferase